MTRYFEYGDEKVAYLKRHDRKLGEAIDAVGHIYREMDEGGLFSGIVHHIIGQQVSNAAQATIWARLQGMPGDVTPEAIASATAEELQSCSTTFKKVDYIRGIADKILSGAFDIEAVEHMSDEEAIEALSSLPGVGRWTAEMLLLFNLGRPDILSFGDLAIQRGMRMAYHHRTITREMFECYRNLTEARQASISGPYPAWMCRATTETMHRRKKRRGSLPQTSILRGKGNISLRRLSNSRRNVSRISAHAGEAGAPANAPDALPPDLPCAFHPCAARERLRAQAKAGTQRDPEARGP
ncbi:DNA-3-methyladenine glycosylase [Atopobium sp. oral taxon 416]|uniref:DNA-3-methyladenine glycosylase family protein n=1 Tax=Atopobium sp. oral taxon 416 TaxID=712157 RepID=UPI002012F3AE|nr:hypothetical protein [Atopobium sp. oral taxon 416]